MRSVLVEDVESIFVYNERDVLTFSFCGELAYDSLRILCYRTKLHGGSNILSFLSAGNEWVPTEPSHVSVDKAPISSPLRASTR